MLVRSKFIKLGAGAATAGLLFLGPLAGLGATPAGASGSYTAFVVNAEWPASNSVTEVTGSGSSWTPGSPLTVASGDAGLTGIAVSPDGSTAYQAVGLYNEIVPIDTSTFTAGTAFSSGGTDPVQDAVTPNDKFLLVVNQGNNTLAVIKTSNTSSVKTVTVGNEALGIAILPNSSAAYITNTADNTVSVVSLVGTPTVTNTISFPDNGCKGPLGDAVTPNGKHVYVSCGNDKLWKIKVATNHAAAKGIKIPHGGIKGKIGELAITPDGKTAYVASGNDVYPVTLSTKTVGTGISQTDAFSVAISPDGAYVMTGENDDNADTVEVIRVSTNTVTDTFSAGGYSHFSIAFQP
jgi:YVTN family beta-propeller protein